MHYDIAFIKDFLPYNMEDEEFTKSLTKRQSEAINALIMTDNKEHLIEIAESIGPGISPAYAINYLISKAYYDLCFKQAFNIQRDDASILYSIYDRGDNDE